MKANGLIIVKPGFDARNAEIKNQVFNSQKNSLKIWMEGHANISVSEYTGSAGTGIGSTDIAHNLGYTPFYLIYFKLQHASKLWLQDSYDASVLAANFVRGQAYTNDTNLHLSVDVNGDPLAAFTATAYYKILIDKAFEV